MDSDNRDRPLNRISTLWTVVGQAHGDTAEAATPAQQQLLQRYGRAVYRYLLGALRDPNAAEDLAQEFALRFLRGDFRGAEPGKGRFRDFVRGVLSHLVADHHRARHPRKQPLPLDGLEPAVAGEPLPDSDRQFLDSWREELLARTWEALGRVQLQTGQPFHTVLRFRAEHPGLRSAQMAEQLSARLGKPLTAAGLRQTLHRAREKFGDLLLDEVAQTLAGPTADALEQELIDLGLRDYCRPALARYRGAP
jgi:DNA-directed RNA polymerase specialized sigma24 family protein